MLKIDLISMPFGNISSPSLALTMLKGVIERRFQERVTTRINYLTFDFAELVGLSAYRELGIDTPAVEQVGDWFFRQAAFPEAPDNTPEYLSHYFANDREIRARLIRDAVRRHRGNLDSWVDRMIHQYDIHRADVVGLTAFWGQSTASIALARRLKQINPDVITVIGGVRCSSPAASALAENVSCLDFVFSGPAVKSFEEFVGFCLEKKMDRCRAIPGVFSRAGRSAGHDADLKPDANRMSPCRQADFGEESDMDLYPELDYDEFMRRYALFTTAVQRDTLAFLPFTTSEGCWWNRCTFCARNGGTGAYRCMSPEKALRQFERLFQYAAPHVLMAGDNTIPPSYLREVFPRLKTPEGMTIQYHVRPNQLTERDFEVLSAARVNILFAGIESFSTATLKSMCKGTTAFDNVIFLQRCRLYDIAATWQLMMGMPGEGAETYEKYIHGLRRLNHLQAPYDHLPVFLTRGSPLYEEAVQRHTDLQPGDSYGMIYPFSQESLRSLAFYLKESTEKAEYAVVRDRYWGPVEDQVRPWKMRWMRHHSAYMEQRDQRAPGPLLVFVPQGEGVVVYDSRLDGPVERPLSHLQTRILESLSSPKRISDLAQELGFSTEIDVDKEMESLRHWGLVFEEDGLYLSLVIGSHASWDKMTTRELVFSLQALDLQLWTEDGRLKYKAAPGVLTEALRRELSQRRDAIAARLQEAEILSKETRRLGAAFLGNITGDFIE